MQGSTHKLLTAVFALLLVAAASEAIADNSKNHGSRSSSNYGGRDYRVDSRYSTTIAVIRRVATPRTTCRGVTTPLDIVARRTTITAAPGIAPMVRATWSLLRRLESA